MKHKTCGLEYLVSPNEFIYTGRRCSKCNTYLPGNNSSGENKVSSWLNKYNYNSESKMWITNFDPENYKRPIKLPYDLIDSKNKKKKPYEMKTSLFARLRDINTEYYKKYEFINIFPPLIIKAIY